MVRRCSAADETRFIGRRTRSFTTETPWELGRSFGRAGQEFDPSAGAKNGEKNCLRAVRIEREERVVNDGKYSETRGKRYGQDRDRRGRLHGRIHFLASKALQDAGVTAICSRDPAKLKRRLDGHTRELRAAAGQG